MAKKASDNLKYYHNPNGPTIGTVSRRVIEQDGLTFKDIDGTGEVTPSTTGGSPPPSAPPPTSRP